MRGPIGYVVIMAVFLAVVSALAAEEAVERAARVVVVSKDVVTGTDLSMNARSVVVRSERLGKVTIERRAVAGIAYGPGRDKQILSSSEDRDTVYLTTGDKVSGEIIGTKGDVLLVKAFYAGGRESRIELAKIDFVTFARSTEDAALEADPVHVILVGGDVVSGTLQDLRRGVFRLETQYAGMLELKLDDIQSLHNAETSRQFFPNGLAEAFLSLFGESGELRREYYNLFPSLIRGLLAQDDVPGALSLLEQMGQYSIDPYTYDQIGRAFESAKHPGAAALCYERMFEQRKQGLQIYRQVFEAYLRIDRYANAAEVYEELLREAPENMINYGYRSSDVRLALAGVYNELNENEKAIGHLRKVLDDPSAEAGQRQRARGALVTAFKQVGRLDELITKYTEELTTLDEQLSADYLKLVESYIERDKLAKARTQVDRLETLGLQDAATQARTLIEQAYAERGWSPDDGNDESSNDTEE